MGGNVFGTTSGIKKEYIQSTLNGFIDELCRIFPLRKEYLESYKVLGSAGKKDVSGDIDLALSNDLVKDSKSWGISPTRVLEYYDKFAKRARTATHEQLMKRAFIVSVADVIESESELIGVDTKGSGSGSLFCTFPQLDENGEQIGMEMLLVERPFFISVLYQCVEGKSIENTEGQLVGWRGEKMLNGPQKI